MTALHVGHKLILHPLLCSSRSSRVSWRSCVWPRSLVAPPTSSLRCAEPAQALLAAESKLPASLWCKLSSHVKHSCIPSPVQHCDDLPTVDVAASLYHLHHDAVFFVQQDSAQRHCACVDRAQPQPARSHSQGSVSQEDASGPAPEKDTRAAPRPQSKTGARPFTGLQVCVIAAVAEVTACICESCEYGRRTAGSYLIVAQEQPHVAAMHLQIVCTAGLRIQKPQRQCCRRMPVTSALEPCTLTQSMCARRGETKVCVCRRR